MPHYNDASVHDVCIRIKRSTVVSSGPAINLCLDVPLPVPPDARQAAQPIRLDVSGSVFGGPNVLGFELVPQKSLDKAAAPQPAEAEATLLRLLKWQGKRNIFAAGSTSVWANQLGQRLPPGPKGLEAWKRFWGGAEADSLEGVLRFQGGNLLPRVGAEGVDLDQLTPGDFRLRPDSAGYRAGKDGKDLGADVDLVGPGPAYERWKKTPEYQQWLKDLKAANAEAAKPVLLMHFDKADFYEKDGKTYVRDRSGKGNDGLCEQVEFTPEGKTGGGLANAGKGFLRLPTSLVAGRSHFTITAWVKRTNLANPWAVYSCHQKVYPASDMPRFNFFCTNHLYVGAWNGASDWVHATALDADISPGEWVFVAVSLENGAPGKGRLQLMLNDRFAEKSLQQVGGEPLETTQDIAALKLEGVFDELTVWHRALTEQELREVFALHQPVSKK
jgi:hypothetical protein